MLRLSVAIAFAGLIGIAEAPAQTYPSRPITMIVPYSAGGPTDTLGRILAEHMRGSLGQSIIIENVTGAGGTIGVGRVARAAPDGYTLGIGQVSTNGFNGATYSLSYDLVKDLAPVALLTIAPMWIIGKADFPASNVKDLIAWLKANPDKATMAAVGWGGASHLCGVYFQKESGTRLTFVPYRGAAPAEPGSGRRADRPVLSGGVELAAAGEERQGQAVRGPGQDPLAGGARRADHRRGGIAGALHPVLARDSSCPPARPRTSSASSMPPRWRRWRIRRRARA